MRGFVNENASCMLDTLLVCIFFAHAHYVKITTAHRYKFSQQLRRTLRRLHHSVNQRANVAITSTDVQALLPPLPIDAIGCLHAVLAKCGVDSLGTQTKVVTYHMKDSSIEQRSSVDEPFLTHVMVPGKTGSPSILDAFSTNETMPPKSSVARITTTLHLADAPILIFEVVRPVHYSAIHFGHINRWKRVLLQIRDELYTLNAVVCRYDTHYICYVWDRGGGRWMYYNPCSGGVIQECPHPETVKIRASEDGELFFYSRVRDGEYV